MKKILAALLILVVAPICASAGDNDIAKLEAAISDEHTCVATASTDKSFVHCELGPQGSHRNENFTVPLSWVRTHFAPMRNGAWISGGYDAKGKPIPAQVGKASM